ncbi:MAG: hypothetical protein AB8B44_02695, partial [Prochlorococcus sp.]
RQVMHTIKKSLYCQNLKRMIYLSLIKLETVEINGYKSQLDTHGVKTNKSIQFVINDPTQMIDFERSL